ncbi:hypothetical protein [Micromonospora violae]|uniref:hypothetical protein n=1 Tax=Micromonospora violae TaxID=1278207 RepID=UPI00102D03F3|nr:hypothetical protein [Micromonospora violae]
MADRGSGGDDRRARATTPQRRTTVGVAVTLGLLAVPLLPIMCLSGLAILLALVPSEPCRPPFVDDPSECGPNPLQLLPAALLAVAYGAAAIVLALRGSLPPWARIGALCVVPVAAIPLVWVMFF